ncbi:MAG TPA: pitrilysin family protein [Candidatus Acidoferrales bacterium]|nr:pitrilysin family protein [Candidatus Acidoferrales bacterium]
MGMSRSFWFAAARLAIASLALAPASGRARQPGGSQKSESQPAVQAAPLDVQTHKLANGLEVVTLEEHSAPIVNLQVWYHVGSKDERPGRTGFAHMFEHLMFKGSAHVAADQHTRLIEQMGGVVNAYTNDDVTVFWETFPSRYLERVLWMEADRMGSLNVTLENFTTEREVVKEERRLRIDNPPYGRVTEDLYAAAFTVHPYHHITIGSMDDLNKATLGDVRDFYSTYYRPDNATLVIVGDFPSAGALAWAEKYFGGIPASPRPIPRVTVTEPPQTSERTLTRSYANSPLPAVVEGFKVPPRFSPDQYPLELASNILSQGQSSLLYQDLVYAKRLALQAFGVGNFTEDPNLFFIGAVLNSGVSVEQGEREVDQVVESMRANPVAAGVLEKAKNQVVARFILARETDQGKADAIGEAAALGKDASLVNKELDGYLQISVGDIQRVSRQYFDKQHETLLLVVPLQAPAPPNPGGGERNQRER